MDDVLEARSLRRRIGTRHFAGALTSLKSAGVVVTLPCHAAEAFTAVAALTRCAPPVPTPRFPVSMAWTSPRGHGSRPAVVAELRPRRSGRLTQSPVPLVATQLQT